jgi:hypothetical protein
MNIDERLEALGMYLELQSHESAKHDRQIQDLIALSKEQGERMERDSHLVREYLRELSTRGEELSSRGEEDRQMIRELAAITGQEGERTREQIRALASFVKDDGQKIRELAALSEQDGEHIRALAKIADVHDRRLKHLEEANRTS